MSTNEHQKSNEHEQYAELIWQFSHAELDSIERAAAHQQLKALLDAGSLTFLTQKEISIIRSDDGELSQDALVNLRGYEEVRTGIMESTSETQKLEGPVYVAVMDALEKYYSLFNDVASLVVGPARMQEQEIFAIRQAFRERTKQQEAIYDEAPLLGRVFKERVPGSGGYVREGEKKVAFQDKGTSLVVRDKKPDCYKAVMELAKSKGWQAIELIGEPEHMARGWIEAQMMGIEVVNYEPTEQDKADLDARRKEMEPKAKEADEASSVPEAVPEAVPEKIVPPVRAVKPQPRQELIPPPFIPGVTDMGEHMRMWREMVEADTALERLKVLGPDVQEEEFEEGILPAQTPALPNSGRLVERGAAFYKFQEPTKKEIDAGFKKPLSYYARLEQPDGSIKTVWAKDVERALADAGVKLGDTVHLEKRGTKSVTGEKLDDKSGKVVAATHEKGDWVANIIEQTSSIVVPEGAKAVISGRYIGSVIDVKDGYVVQQSSPGKFVAHKLSDFEKVPCVGEILDVQYSKEGKVMVSEQKAKGRETGRV